MNMHCRWTGGWGARVWGVATAGRVVLLCVLAAGDLFAQGEVRVDGSISVSRPRVYCLEKVTIVLSVSSVGASLDSNIDLAGMPDPAMLKLGTFQELQPTRAVRDGQVVETRRFQCEAQALKPGTVTLAPGLRVGVLQRARGMFGSTMIRRGLEVGVQPVPLQIQALPENGRPADWSGAVGVFDLGIEVSPTNLVEGELVEVAMRVRGQGHLDGVSAPQLPAGRNFRVYPPKRVSSEPGAVLFSQTVVPQSTNALVIPAASFCFFDTQAGRYRTVTAGPVALSFHAGGKQEFEHYVRTAPSSNVVAAASDAGRRFAEFARESARMKAPVRALFVSLLCAYAVLVIGLAWWLAGSSLLAWLTRRLAGGKVRLLVRVTPWLVVFVGVALFLPVAGLLRETLGGRAGLVQASRGSARLAPAAGALVTFEVPDSGMVRVVGVHNDWVKIDLDGKRGWVHGALLKGTGD